MSRWALAFRGSIEYTVLRWHGVPILGVPAPLRCLGATAQGFQGQKLHLCEVCRDSCTFAAIHVIKRSTSYISQRIGCLKRSDISGTWPPMRRLAMPGTPLRLFFTCSMPSFQITDNTVWISFVHENTMLLSQTFSNMRVLKPKLTRPAGLTDFGYEDQRVYVQDNGDVADGDDKCMQNRLGFRAELAMHTTTPV